MCKVARACHARIHTPRRPAGSQPLPLNSDSMAAFAAIATIPGRDANAPFPLLRMVGDYLSLDQLMPPCRLRWSRRLGRPMMEMLGAGDRFGDNIGAVYIEEVLPYTALIAGYIFMERSVSVTKVGMWTTTCQGMTRRDFWRVEVRDQDYEDLPYCGAWMQRYGCAWPLIAPGCLHPALERLYRAYEDFSDEASEYGHALARANRLG